MVDSIPKEDIIKFINEYKAKEDITEETILDCFLKLVDEDENYRLSNDVYKEMKARFDKYNEDNGASPLIISIRDGDKCTGDYVSLPIFLDIADRWWKYVERTGDEPNFVTVTNQLKPEEVPKPEVNCFGYNVSSDTNYKVTKGQFYIMVANYNDYKNNHGEEPLIIGITDEEHNCVGDYVSKEVFLNMWIRWVQYKDAHNQEEPNYVMIVGASQPAPQPPKAECGGRTDPRPYTTPLCQVTDYDCSTHSVMQVCYQLLGIDISEENLRQVAINNGWLGYEGAGHSGLEAQLNYASGGRLGINWVNFSSIGWCGIFDILTDPNRTFISHTLLSNKYGHYQIILNIDFNNSEVKEQYSVGNCSLRDLSFGTYQQWMSGINQPGIGIVYKK